MSKALALWLAGTAAANSHRLFFSEYSTDGVNEAALEIYNPSPVDVDLSAYTIKCAAQGGALSAGSTYVLSGVLEPGQAKVVCSSAGTHCTTGLTNADITLSGDRAVALYHNGVLLDVIGLENQGTGIFPTVAGTLSATLGYTMRRQPWVDEGTTAWSYPDGKANSGAASQWYVGGLTNGGLLWHDVDFGTSPMLLKVTCGSTGEEIAAVYVHVAGHHLQLECPLDCHTKGNQSVVGVNVYSQASHFCLAAVHAGAMALDGVGMVPDNVLASPGSAAMLPYCEHGLMRVASADGSGPRLSYAVEADQAFTASYRNCVSTGSGGSGPAFSASALSRAHAACLNDCNHYGSCNLATLTCECRRGYAGDDCTAVCDPPCYHGSWCSFGVCVCNANHQGPGCLQKTCADLNNCNSNGVCDALLGLCTCDAGYAGSACDLRACVDDCSHHGVCDASEGTCACNAGYDGPSCAWKGCQEDCSGRGACDSATGLCTCTDGGSGSCRLGSCPGACSGHGSCDHLTRLCKCDSRWTGAACSVAVEFPSVTAGVYWG